MNPFTDNEQAQQDRAAERQVRDAEWRACKPTKHTTHVAHAVLRDGSMRRIEVEAADRQQGAAKVFAKFPPCSIESVSCWPVRGQAKVAGDALTLRVGPSPAFDSAFGCLA